MIDLLREYHSQKLQDFLIRLVPGYPSITNLSLQSALLGLPCDHFCSVRLLFHSAFQPKVLPA